MCLLLKYLCRPFNFFDVPPSNLGSSGKECLNSFLESIFNIGKQIHVQKQINLFKGDKPELPTQSRR